MAQEPRACGCGGRISAHEVVETGMPADLVFFESTLAYYLFNSGYLEPLDEFGGRSWKKRGWWRAPIWSGEPALWFIAVRTFIVRRHML